MKTVSHWCCRTSAILKYFCPLRERDTCEQSLHSSLILSSAQRDTSTDLYKPVIKDINWYTVKPV